GGRERWTSLEGALELDWRRTALELWASRAQSDAAAAERDLVRLGGAPSSLAPRRHEPGRREHPALPADALVGERIDAFGARLELAGTPAALFWERHEAAPGGGARLELVGLEVRGRMANQPLLGLPRLEWRIGVGHGREGIVEGETRWWLGLTLPGFGTPGRAATAPFERRAAR
ncbi:MAG TPA: hypothetical protein VI942_00720, partial [Thermoanaerobaculia bacterium]|nr:hypothetical protein [Thermoanaerobaculia bacterium]